MAAEPATLAAVAEVETPPAAHWRWWWLAILGTSAIAWALVIICAGVLTGWLP